MSLTEVDFWENYWRNVTLPVEVDLKQSFDRCLADHLRKILSAQTSPGQSVLEIGCAPGKWLGFFRKEFGLIPHGIEYSPMGTKATIENLSRLGFDRCEILAGDFFKLDPKPIHDVVCSFGFIEHFENPEEVIARHLAWLKPGGVLILGVPNFQGIHFHAQKWLEPEVLDLHNLKTMQASFWESLVSKLKIKKISVDRIGSFEPSLPLQSKRSNRPKQILVKIAIRFLLQLRKIKSFDAWNPPWISSYWMSVYRKGGT